MRIYLNAQFSDGNHRTHLLSVGMVSELGEFYRIVNDGNAVEHALRNQWLREHVLVRLPLEVEGRDWDWAEVMDDAEADVIVSRRGLTDDLLDYVDSHPEPELWAWQGAYAYVAVRHLFGRLKDRPANFPAWCGELTTEWIRAGRPELPPRGERGHHALEQARWARAVDGILAEAPE